MPVSYRAAVPADAGPVADLHADSWRRHYRGAYSDSFLDGDVVADRRTVWSSRLAAPGGTYTVVASDGGRLVGFIHIVFDADPVWGSLVDNLHVAHHLQRTGVGRGLLSHARPPMYLWVLEQNTAAQRFYEACGGVCVETATVSAPGGDPTRLAGAPRKLRMAWRDA